MCDALRGPGAGVAEEHKFWDVLVENHPCAPSCAPSSETNCLSIWAECYPSPRANMCQMPWQLVHWANAVWPQLHHLIRSPLLGIALFPCSACKGKRALLHCRALPAKMTAPRAGDGAGPGRLSPALPQKTPFHGTNRGGWAGEVMLSLVPSMAPSLCLSPRGV